VWWGPERLVHPWRGTSDVLTASYPYDSNTPVPVSRLADALLLSPGCGASALTHSTRRIRRIERALDALSVGSRRSRFGYPFVTQTRGKSLVIRGYPPRRTTIEPDPPS
jgi:hypothetical protein